MAAKGLKYMTDSAVKSLISIIGYLGGKYGVSRADEAFIKKESNNIIDTLIDLRRVITALTNDRNPGIDFKDGRLLLFSSDAVQIDEEGGKNDDC